MPTLVKNKKAFYNYHILEKMEGGLVLIGQEVKALKEGKGSLFGSFLSIKSGEVYLVNCNITPYQPKNTPKNYNPQRDRKVLLNKNEIKNLIGKTKEKGVTFIPLSIYTKKNYIKLEFAVAKGKKKYDKREAIKKRDIDRNLQKKLKEF